MISRRTQENLMAVAFLALFVAVIWEALDFGPRARMVPLPVATFGIVLIVIQLIWQNLRSTQDLQMGMFESLTKRGREAVKEEPEARPEAAARRPEWVREAAAYGMVATIVGLILLLGPIPAVFLFTGGFFVVTRHYSFVKGLVYTLCLTAAIYLLFVVALEIQLYHGILEPLVERFLR
ncbi:MAG: tripartite tricarboxylate transporter TctB family protein [Betaproteobacteria bacterium]|nr:tripartite tricarboxylate transporter TctB family protein [Betaproteobacteria bacterium]